MVKIPVGATIAHAYRFAFGHFLDILRVVWIPLLLGLILSAFIQGHALEMQQAVDAQLYGRAGQLLLMMLPAYAAALVFLCMEMEGATRLALGKLPEPGFYYLEAGRPLWRFLGAVLLAGLILAGIAIAAMLAVGIVGALYTMVAGAEPQAAAGLSIVFLTFAVVGALFYVMLRLTFLLAPSVVAQEQVNLLRGWALAKGNVGRILVVLLATLIPFFLVVIVAVFAFAGFPPMPGPDADPVVFDQISRDWEIALNARMAEQWYLVYPASFLASVVMLGLTAGAQSFAWRSLTEGGNAA